MTTKPTARTDDLIIEHLDQEVLIYDLRVDRATCLNAWTARLWHLADGTRDVDDLARDMDSDAELIASGLAQLAEQGLMEGETEAALIRRAMTPELTRREVMGQITGAAKLAAAAVPGVVAITVPTPVRAASGGCNAALFSTGFTGIPGTLSPVGITMDMSCAGGSATEPVFSSTDASPGSIAAFGCADQGGGARYWLERSMDNPGRYRCLV